MAKEKPKPQAGPVLAEYTTAAQPIKPTPTASLCSALTTPSSR